MPPADRFTVSLDTELLAAFDAYIAARGYVNRSEAIRDLIRDALVSAEVEGGGRCVVSVITFLCDVRSTSAAARVRALILRASSLRPSVSQSPVDEHHDLWIVTLRGPSSEIESLTQDMRSVRGVLRLSATIVAPHQPPADNPLSPVSTDGGASG